MNFIFDKSNKLLLMNEIRTFFWTTTPLTQKEQIPDKINPRIPLEKALYKYICKSSTLYLVDASPKKLTQELIVYWVQQKFENL
jgi:hypothetical protein